MSTVFHGFYADNLKRLLSQTEELKRGKISKTDATSRTEQTSKTFADILAATERNTVKTQNIRLQDGLRDLGSPDAENEEETSNLRPEERDLLNPLNTEIKNRPGIFPASPTILAETFAPQELSLTHDSANMSMIGTNQSISLLTPGRLPPQNVTGLPKATEALTDIREVSGQSGLPPKSPVILSAQKIMENDLSRSDPSRYTKSELRQMIATSGRFHGVDPLLGLAVAHTESSLKTRAVSQDGHHSKGVFQLLDSTGRYMMKQLKVSEAYDPFDPALNTHLGMGYLKRLQELFSTDTKLTRSLTTHAAKSSDHLEKLAVAAFNAGEGAVARAQRKTQESGQDPSDYDSVKKHLPKQTQRYVAAVTALRGALSDIV